MYDTSTEELATTQNNFYQTAGFSYNAIPEG
jgi:hypothetical protein